MTDRPDAARDDALAAALEDFHRRKALGEAPKVEEYAARLGESQVDFREIVKAEEALDGAMTLRPLEPLPRTFGGYTLLKEIGRGAAGFVYEALDRNLGRTVAVKILRSGIETDANALERFRREARACAQVRHDHIVPIHEAGEIMGRPFYSMDLVYGDSLATLVKAKRVPDPKTLCTKIAHVADALQALHEHKEPIIHRDVKPSNLVVREKDGEILIADFGLARTAGAVSLTQTGDALGTPLYMSPEQMLAQRDEVDARTDVYGLGATLYEALTGVPPFQTDEVPALMKMVINDRPQSMRALAPDVPLDCERIVLKALEKRKEDRYASAKEMAEDLRRFARGLPVFGGPVAPVVRVLRIVRKQWIPIAASVLAVAGGAYLLQNRTAHLSVTNAFFPPEGVTVAIDDGTPIPVPFEIDLPRGRHKLAFHRDFFQDREETLELAAGDRFPLRAEMQIDRVKLRSDPAAGKYFSKAMGEEGAAFGLEKSLPDTRRGVAPDKAVVELLIPRGDVRPEDLSVFAVRLEGDVGPPGTLEFRLGKEVLDSRSFDPKYTQTWLPLPAVVRERAKVGDTLTWSWIPKNSRGALTTISAEFRIVDADPKVKEEIRNIETMLSNQKGSLLQYYRGRRLLRAGLYTGAFQDLDSVVEADSADVSAWTTMLVVLEKFKMTDSSTFADIAEWVKGPTGRAPSLRPPLRQ